MYSEQDSRFWAIHTLTNCGFLYSLSVWNVFISVFGNKKTIRVGIYPDIKILMDKQNTSSIVYTKWEAWETSHFFVFIYCLNFFVKISILIIWKY